MRRRYPGVRRLSTRFPGPWDEAGQLNDGTPILAGPVETLQGHRVVVVGGAPSVTGIAFGERLRLHYLALEPDWLHGPTVGRRRALGYSESEPDPVWGQLVSEVNSLAAQFRSAGLGHPQDEERLGRLCGVLALYQSADVARARTSAMLDTPITQEPASSDLGQLMAYVNDELAQAVTALMKLAASRLPEPAAVRSAQAEVRVGGAAGRADLILDGLLLEVKVVKQARLTAEYAYQVLDYLLGSDLVDVGRVGWYFARHGLLWEFPVDEFLETLAGEPVSLSQARAEYRRVFAWTPCST